MNDLLLEVSRVLAPFQDVVNQIEIVDVEKLSKSKNLIFKNPSPRVSPNLPGVGIIISFKSALTMSAGMHHGSEGVSTVFFLFFFYFFFGFFIIFEKGSKSYTLEFIRKT